ncbi:MAG: hypothetical protein EBS83_03405 [Planctomycetia bacterium]|jgi:segregation and condensation protein B|nr:hypothetical protein [Planctomycetia bacterium]NDH93844.1 hypothetical protein [Planctomycetia bacterium]
MPPPENDSAAGFQGPPADGGMSIDRLAQAFAAMMGEPDPYAAAESGAEQLVEVDASPDLDQAGGNSTSEPVHCRVDPRSILEALLFVGLPGGEPLSSRRVARLMRGVRAAEIDALAAELGDEYTANGCPYEVISNASGWLLRLRDEYRQFGVLLEAKTRRVRLDAAALDALAVVAWNQPVARGKLTELGCDASPALLRQLVRRGLLELVKPSRDGADASGGEPTYQTTKKFLDVFQLRTLDDLPDPREPPR